MPNTTAKRRNLAGDCGYPTSDAAGRELQAAQREFTRRGFNPVGSVRVAPGGTWDKGPWCYELWDFDDQVGVDGPGGRKF